MTVSADYQRLTAAESQSGLPLVGQLLAYAATGAPLGHDNRQFAWRPEGVNARQFQWAVDGGLGPLLHRATRDCADVVPTAWREALLSADLTARVRHGNLVDSTLEIIEVCAGLQAGATLLKGISVSEEFYPAEHLRPMADIDVLIPAHAYASVEAALLECGYGRLNHPAIDGHHHGAPLRHAARRTIVELHTVLFRSDSPLCERLLFSLPNVLRRSVRSLYHAMPVKRLSHELQLAYIASSWFNDLTQCKVHPSFVASLLDAVYLLSACRQTLQWKKMLEWLDNDMAKASLYTMVTYLPRYGVEPLSPADLALLASAQRLVGPIQLRMIHRMLDRHLIGGRPWNFAFPPPVPGRYSVSQQFRKKILSRLR
ncbi:MAG: nucleotidyltransferase family protein [Methylibium sp.]|uniref:nucleotidyltransferase family protein n=1 Tax=Methylibium sp. TaxID=2067992 RepID=UPI0017BB277F|nr:nucleotidyltransferase family protein [Methylibium sp.]MBA2722331.1 nucleotidyltransferase family protein [Methylibium sp.]MBA3590163.1 nucleotidyltransferase family protein [Methylibium sp.]